MEKLHNSGTRCINSHHDACKGIKKGTNEGQRMKRMRKPTWASLSMLEAR